MHCGYRVTFLRAVNSSSTSDSESITPSPPFGVTVVERGTLDSTAPVLPPVDIPCDLCRTVKRGTSLPSLHAPHTIRYIRLQRRSTQILPHSSGRIDLLNRP